MFKTHSTGELSTSTIAIASIAAVAAIFIAVALAWPTPRTFALIALDHNTGWVHVMDTDQSYYDCVVQKQDRESKWGSNVAWSCVAEDNA